MTTDNPFVDAEGAAEILGCHVNKVYDIAQSGDLAGAKDGFSGWRFLRQTVIDYLKAEIERQTRERREKRCGQDNGASMPAIKSKRRRRSDAFTGAGA